MEIPYYWIEQHAPSKNPVLQRTALLLSHFSPMIRSI